jgi:periplasmic protein CpxP/Spy
MNRHTRIDTLARSNARKGESGREPQTQDSAAFLKEEPTMFLSAEQREQVAAELKRFATDLNLSEDQKQRLHYFLTDAYQKVQEYRERNPNASKEDLIRRVAENRTAIRERIVSFLTPEQLTKWDAEVARAKEFLGQKIAA